VACIDNIHVTVTSQFSENIIENDAFKAYKYVISGVPSNVTAEEMKKFAGCDQGQRITRRANGRELPTKTCVVTYDEELALSVTLKFDFLSYKVRHYVSNSMQSKYCFQFGHSSKHCRHTAVCSHCSSVGHSADKCQLTATKCTNCDGNHAANSKLCTKYVQIKHILAVATSDKQSNRDAARNLHQSLNRPSRRSKHNETDRHEIVNHVRATD